LGKDLTRTNPDNETGSGGGDDLDDLTGSWGGGRKKGEKEDDPKTKGTDKKPDPKPDPKTTADDDTAAAEEEVPEEIVKAKKSLKAKWLIIAGALAAAGTVTYYLLTKDNSSGKKPQDKIQTTPGGKGSVPPSPDSSSKVDPVLPPIEPDDSTSIYNKIEDLLAQHDKEDGNAHGMDLLRLVTRSLTAWRASGVQIVGNPDFDQGFVEEVIEKGTQLEILKAMAHEMNISDAVNKMSEDSLGTTDELLKCFADVGHNNPPDSISENAWRYARGFVIKHGQEENPELVKDLAACYQIFLDNPKIFKIVQLSLKGYGSSSTKESELSVRELF
jgi:hypothetical protein